jgi:galactoside O-acetyltransferase
MRDSVLLQNFDITIINAEERKYVSIGDDNMLDCKILFESGAGEVEIGDRVYIGASKIICRSKIEFGNNIFVAWGVFFYDHDSHSLDFESRRKDIAQQLVDYRNGDFFIKNKNWGIVGSAPIKVCDDSWIGMNSIILKGVTIGEGSVVAAGSVVTKSVAPWTLVGGNPAKFIRNLK